MGDSFQGTRRMLASRVNASRLAIPTGDDSTYMRVGVLVIAALLGAVSLSLDSLSPDMWIALGLALLLVAGSVPLFSWIAKVEGDPWLSKVLMWGLLASFAFAVLRYLFIFALYGGGDAHVYHEAGRTFVEHLRSGEPIHPIPVIEPYPPETRRIGDIAGLIYTVVRPNIYAGFLLFTYVCFIGKVFLIRAVKVALPEADDRRFAVLVLFLPSLLFWPASIGKEAVMMACLGLIVFGGALLLAPRARFRGVPYFAAGASIVLLIRPHIALMSILSFGLAIALGVLGRQDPAGGGSSRGRILRLAGLALVVALGVVGSARLAQQFEKFSEDGTGATLEGALQQSSIGESEFTPASVTSPVDLPAGIVSVLLRPFPFEAGSVAELASSLEGVVLLGLVVLSWRRLTSLPHLAARRPFLVFMTGYIVLFSIGFSFIANFGILSRQRILVLPAVLVLLALPRRGSIAGVSRSEAAAAGRAVATTLKR